MLKAPYTSANNATQQADSSGAPFQQSAGNHAAGQTHPVHGVLSTPTPFAGASADHLNDWSWSYSSFGSNVPRADIPVASFDRQESNSNEDPEEDAPVDLHNTSFYGLENSGLDDSFFQLEGSQLLESLSLEHMVLHVHSSPNRLLHATRVDVAPQDLSTPYEYPMCADSFFHEEMAALAIEEIPAAAIVAHLTGCVEHGGATQ